MIPETGASSRPDPDLMRSMLTAIMPPGEPFEVRVLKCRKRGTNGLTDDPYVKAQSGYFTDVDKAVAAASHFTGDHAAGVHVTFNDLAGHVMSWGADRIAPGRATSDADVLRYRHLYVDVDPVRPSDTNATPQERGSARERAGQVLAYLRDLDWPDPAWAGGSGSGSMMLFRIDLALEDRPFYERVLHGLNDLFGDDDVHIDTSTGNPARLVRLAGAVNAKAITPTADRPWTLATGQAMPNADIVTREQLAAIAAAEPEPVTREPFTGEGDELPAILTDSGIQHREKQASYGTVYEIADCLTSTDHTDGACFIQFHSGAVAYKCLHARCSGKGWPDVKPLLTLPERRSGATLNARQTNATGATDKEPATYRLQTRKASDIEPKEIQWIWKPWLPGGMLGLFAGYGGSGKSTVALHIAAACSVGGTLPDGQPAPLLNTLIFAAEDSPEHTIRPRLESMGANLERIHIVDGAARDGDDPGWVQLRNHAPLIEQAVNDHDIGLVIVDPVSSFIGDANSDNESDVRSGITPLIQVAERTGAAVLMIRHVSKGETSRAASRILGSTAWHDIPRVAWMLADAPDDHQPEPHEDGTRDTCRVLGVVKANLAAKPQARWCIQPVDGPLRWLPDPSPVTIDECFTAQSDRGKAIIQDRAKTAAGARSVRLTARTLAALKEHRTGQLARRLAAPEWHDHDLIVCTGKGTPVNPNNVARSFNALVRETGLRRIRPHDLRHTSATLLLLAGTPAKIVSERLGHASVGITLDLYSHVLPDMQGDAATAMDGILDRAMIGSA